MSTTKPVLTVEIDFDTDLSAGLAYYEKVAADGPYVWYRLKETSGTTAADASGNGLTGTYSGTITYDQTSGKPVTGETASRYIDIASVGRIAFAQPPAGTNHLTLEAWVYRATLDGNSATRYMIADADGDSDGNDWMGWSVRGDGSIHMKSGNCDWTSTTTPVTAAAWHHLAVVMDVEADTLTFYRNGAALSATFSPAIDANKIGFQRTGAVSWYWGKAIDNTTNSTVSRIAEPAVYTDALQPSQLLDHYTAAAVTPFAGYTWTDVTDYVLADPGVSRAFGREGNTEDLVPMELSYTLVNDDRRFEFGNTASPYTPLVVPGRPTRVTMLQDAVTYEWAFGFIEDFPQQWDQSGQFGRVPIVAHDYSERMNQDELNGRTFREQAAGSRITVLANISGVPLANRDIDAGAENVMTQTLEGGSAGDHARQVARTDRGLVYFDGRGYLIFQDGDYRTTDARSTGSRGTLGPAGSVDIVTLGAPVFHAPASLIRNQITIRRPGGVDQVAADSTSRAKHGHRSYTDELVFVTDAAAAARAAALLADYSDPSLRVQAISFNPERSPGQWGHALGVQLSDRYTWRFEPRQGAAIVRDVFVEGVSDRWAGSEYRATWFLSLASAPPPAEAGSFRGLLALTG
jgi:hypothetical protein